MAFAKPYVKQGADHAEKKFCGSVPALAGEGMKKNWCAIRVRLDACVQRDSSDK
jgi:hypothetical protein